MTRSFFMAALLAATGAAAASAQSQSKVLVLIGHPVDNEFYFGHNADDPAILSQRVIPSKKGLRGVSFEESIIKPDSSVNSQTPIKAFVTTANWPNGSPFDVGPVEDIQIDGGQEIIDITGPDEADVAHAVKISTQHVRVRNSKIRRWKGIGVQTTSPIDIYGSSSNQIFGNTIHHCHAGILATSDVEITNNTIFGCRDYGIYSGSIPSGNVYIAHNHIYGINDDDAGIYNGIPIYNTHGNTWRLVNNHIADSHFGYVSGGGDCHSVTFTNCTFARNSKHNVQINAGATNHQLDTCMIVVSQGSAEPEFDDVIGLEFAGNRNAVSDSLIWLGEFRPNGIGNGNSVATGIRISGDANTCLNCVFLDFKHPAGKARGIHIPSAVNGFTADIRLWGFEHSGDVVLDIGTAAIEGVHVVIRGNSEDSSAESNGVRDFTPSDIAQYVNIPAGWDGTKNSITLIDEATNTTVTAVGGTAY